MEMAGLQIFKYLPGGEKLAETNCKKCGCPTCMAFALKLAKKSIEIEKCPYVCEDLISKYRYSVKNPQKTIDICGLTVGGENVLYRHEKTFINRPPLAVIVDCTCKDYYEKIQRISNFSIKSVNEDLKVDLIILKNLQGVNIDLGKSLIPTISWEEFIKFDLNFMKENDFKSTVEDLIYIRTKAILEKDDNFSKPTCVYIKSGNLFEICARASYYICKYANMLVFEDFDENLFATLLTLRQNIFTDPQKTLQVEPGLYKFNDPNEDSIVFLTTNFALTFFAVANELESLDVPSYLIVIPADGMSVLTAWSAEKFTAKIVAKTINELDIRNKIKNRDIIIPGLLSYMKEELHEESPDFNFIVGTNEASEIGNFVKHLS